MNSRAIVILSVFLLLVASIGVVVFAADDQTQVASGDYRGYFCHASGEDREAMIQAMRDRGWEDSIRFMESGDFAEMDEFMNNLNDDDFQEMIDLMRESGYESMAKMMEFMASEEMMEMHHSMHGRGSHMRNMHRQRSGMWR